MQWKVEIRCVGRCAKCGAELRGHMNPASIVFGCAPGAEDIEQAAPALASAVRVSFGALAQELHAYERHMARKEGCHVCPPTWEGKP
jgi:hypothetical protein